MKRFLKHMLASAALAVIAAPASAAYPERPITLTVGYPAGGITDLVAREVARYLTEDLKQTIVVDNKPGASGAIAASSVARAQPDGYTLYFAIASHTIVPALNTIQYDTVRDLVGVAMVSTSPNVLAVRSDFPAQNLQEFIDYAKKNPGKVDYATPGYGTTTHVTAVGLERAAGIKLTHIPYKGQAAAVQATLAGDVPAWFASVFSALPYGKSGQVRILAVAGDDRVPELPDVPTFAEAGAPGIVGDNWLGVIAPAGTPPEVISRLEEAIATLQKNDAFKNKLAEMGMATRTMGSAEFQAMIASEVDYFKDLAKAIELKQE